jgi:lysozyme family protein
MADFDQAIGVILRHEGGWVNDPADPGGATNYGISLRFALLELTKDKDGDGFLDGDFNHDGIIDAADMRDMNVQDAIRTYKTYIWDPKPFSGVVDQLLGTKFFDMTVNMGWRQACIIVQRALDGKVKVDGDVGPISLAAINMSHPYNLTERICQEQEKFYVALAQQKPKLAKFLPGWLKRASWPYRKE